MTVPETSRKTERKAVATRETPRRVTRDATREKRRMQEIGESLTHDSHVARGSELATELPIEEKERR